MAWISTLSQSMASSLRHKSQCVFAEASVKSYARKISFWGVIRGFRQLDATFAILESTQKAHSTWWFQNVCVFTLKIGEMIQFDYFTYFFQMGFKNTSYISIGFWKNTSLQLPLNLGMAKRPFSKLIGSMYCMVYIYWHWSHQYQSLMM